ncbi:MAG: MBL fold metallo-hydrolase RNA specificity domain-containing protein [Candidatus Hydrothermia bacterium]
MGRVRGYAFPLMATRLHILDGAESIGGTKMILEEDGSGVILDFGLNYSRLGLFFDKFLPPRSTRGIVDFIMMGLLPRFRDLYRDDVCMDHHGLSDLQETGIDIKAALFTHPHFDHTGMGGFLREDIPFYASPACALTAKASQDTRRSDTGHELVYARPRFSDGSVVKAPRKKDEGEKVARFRSWRLFCKDTHGFHDFWQEVRKDTVRPECHFPEPVGSEFRAGPFGVRVFPVDHSAPGAVAFALETGSGWIVYTGDLRKHGYGTEKTMAFLEAASALSPIRALVVEGTKAGEDPGPSEDLVADRLMEVVKRAEGKLVNAEFPLRHPERLSTFFAVARDCGRKLVLLPSEFYTVYALSLDLPELVSIVDAVRIYDDPKARYEAYEEWVRESYQNKLVDAATIGRNPGEFLTSFRYWSINKLLDIPNIAGGIHIYSTSEPHSEEQEWDLNRLKMWLDFFGIKMEGDPKADPKDPLHASGHASGTELLEIINALKPKEVIPVHTENWCFFAKKVRCCPVREPDAVIDF